MHHLAWKALNIRSCVHACCSAMDGDVSDADQALIWTSTTVNSGAGKALM